VIDQADLILMIDVDVPWMPSKVRPAAGAQLFHIDLDPTKDRLGYWTSRRSAHIRRTV